ncbi:MAG TPA: pseudouridine-5'-phosphate glycosidase [Candidatus Acidoferrum sp.]|jgi:pseudouridine-5'-phosphate glycosidase|nr:pseudouridine-5'-phosphate glycosidase [Candidatus Acidoferrum sp.]
MNAIRVSPQVHAALEERRPVVALESTILAHGMPYPRNLETALAVEDEVRAGGAVPATIAVLEGTIRIGLDERELERVATSPQMLKLSRADLAYAIAERRDGATTVAATMLCAHRAGIAVFATGGIGGVHRGVASSLDISADLSELARTPVLVVCAGAKAILDIPKTLEVLETLGVPTAVYRSDEFPAFWSRGSGLPAPLRCDDPAAIAAIFRTARQLETGNGMLVANPIDPALEIPHDTIAEIIERAVTEAARQQIGGKALTPWLLDRVFTLTQGRSLEANIGLVRSNARLAAEIASQLLLVG